MKPTAILETILYAGDLDAATRFYGEVLGLRAHRARGAIGMCSSAAAIRCC